MITQALKAIRASDLDTYRNGNRPVTLAASATAFSHTLFLTFADVLDDWCDQISQRQQFQGR